MMRQRKQRDAVWQTLSVAFYALAQQLEAAGVLDQEKLAQEIERFDPGDNPFLRGELDGLVTTLRSRPFAPRGLIAIDGGKSGSGG